MTDRIVLTLPASDEALLHHADWIAGETLADVVEARSVDAPLIAKV